MSRMNMDELAQVADSRFLRRFFKKWKAYRRDEYAVPATSGIIVAACFKWMNISFGLPSSSRLESSYFLDENDPVYLISRIGTSLVDKLHLPVKNFPLFSHAIALYDAHQLQSLFLAWKNLVSRLKKVDRQARLNALRRGLGKWRFHSRRRLYLQILHDRVASKRIRKSTRKALVSWHIVYRTCVFYRLRTVNRAKFSTLLSLRIHQFLRTSQRLFISNGIKHHYRRQLSGCYKRWMARLNRVSATFQDLTILHSMLLDQIGSSYLHSSYYRFSVIAGITGRSHFYQTHSLIAAHTRRAVQDLNLNTSGVYETPIKSALKQSLGGGGRGTEGSRSGRPRSTGGRGGGDRSSNRANIESQLKRRRSLSPTTSRWSLPTTPAAAAAGSSSTGGAGGRARSPTDSELDLFSPSALFRSRSPSMDITFSSSTAGGGGDVYSPIGVYQTPPARTRNSHPSPSAERSGGVTAAAAAAASGVSGSHGQSRRRVTIGSAPSTPFSGGLNVSQNKQKTDVMHFKIYHSLLDLLHSNLNSRRAQDLLTVISDRFARSRALLHAVRQWQHRTVQSELDSMRTNTGVLFGPNRLFNSLNRDIRHSDTDGDTHLYFMRMSMLFRRWISRTRRSVYLNSRESYVAHRAGLIRQTECFGVWLIAAAKEEQLRRAANRLSCTRLAKIMHMAFYAWSTLYSRTLLIRNNQRDEIIRRNAEVRAFIAHKTQKDAERTQQEILKLWSLHIRDLRKGRRLMAIWRRTGGRRLVRSAVDRWKLILSLDVIVTCFKRIWRGYKVRKLTHPTVYRHLRWFGPQYRKYSYHRSMHCKRVVWDVLVGYVQSLVEPRRREVMRVQQGRGVKHLKKFKSKTKFFHRLLVRGERKYEGLLQRRALLAFHTWFVVNSLYRRHAHRQNRKVLHLAVCLLRGNAAHRRQYFDAAMSSDRNRRSWAVGQFRWWQRRVCRRHLQNKETLRVYRLRSHLAKLVDFNRRRQRVYSFQQLQLRKHAHRLIFFWRHQVDVRIHLELVAWNQFKRHRLRRTLYRLFNTAHRNKYGQRLVTSHFHIQKRERAISSLLRSHLLDRFIGLHRTLRQFRRQRQQCRRAARKHQLRSMRVAFVQFYYCWKRRHPLQHMGIVSLRISQDQLKNRREDHYGNLRRRGRSRSRDGGSEGLLEGGGGDHLDASFRRSSLGGGGGTTLEESYYDSEGDEPSRGRAVRRGSNSSTGGGGGNRLQSHEGSDLSMAARVILRNAQTSIKRGLISERALKAMTTNLKRTGNQNRCARILTKWVANYRYNAHLRAVNAHNEKESLRYVMKKCLFRLFKSLIWKKRARHELSLERRALRLRSLRKNFNILRSIHLERRQDRRLLRIIERDREDYHQRHFLNLLRISRAYYVKHHLFRYVASMRHGGKVFFSRMRYFVERYRKSPARYALYKQYFRVKKRNFKRFKYFTLLQRQGALVCLVASDHHRQHHMLRSLRYWHQYAQLKRRMKRINRRFLLVPSWKCWFDAACDLVKHNHILRVMHRKISLRTKKTALFLWKLYTCHESRIRLQGRIVEKKRTDRVKANVLYTMMRLIDNRVSHSKYELTQQLHARYIKKRAFFFWHKHYLFNYMCAWKAARLHFHAWQRTVYWWRRQARHCRDAITYQYRRSARRLLIRWCIAARRLRQRRLKMVVKQRIPAKKFLRWFRRWQWWVRMIRYWQYRRRGSSRHNDEREVRHFNKGRLFDKWRRVAKANKFKRRRQRMKNHFIAWKKCTHTMKFAREAFIDRLTLCRRSIFQRYYFHRLIDNASVLRSGRALAEFTLMVTQSRHFQWWRKAFKHRMDTKMRVVTAMTGIYKVQVAHKFQLWKIRARHGFKIDRVQLMKYTWGRWRRAWAARVQHRSHWMRLVFARWKALMLSMDAQKRRLLKIRRRVFTITTKKMRCHLLWVALAFKRWHTRDASLHLRDYLKYTHLLPVPSSVDPTSAALGGKKRGGGAGALYVGDEHGHSSGNTSIAPSELYANLAHSHAGAALCSQDLSLSKGVFSGYALKKHVVPERLQSIQTHLHQKFLSYEVPVHHPQDAIENVRDVNRDAGKPRGQTTVAGGVSKVGQQQYLQQQQQQQQRQTHYSSATPQRTAVAPSTPMVGYSTYGGGLVSPVSAVKSRKGNMHVHELM